MHRLPSKVQAIAYWLCTGFHVVLVGMNGMYGPRTNSSLYIYVVLVLTVVTAAMVLAWIRLGRDPDEAQFKRDDLGQIQGGFDALTLWSYRIAYVGLIGVVCLTALAMFSISTVLIQLTGEDSQYLTNVGLLGLQVVLVAVWLLLASVAVPGLHRKYKSFKTKLASQY